MTRTFALLLVCAVAGLLSSGCATLGSAIKMGGTVTGYQELSSMGGSMEKAGREFNEEEKYFIGRTVAATLMADEPWQEDKALTQYVNAVGQTLMMASDKPEIFGGYHFGVLKSDKFNAYACPGGFVFISSALMKNCKTEDELAAVLAHEMAHMVLNHPMQAIKASHERQAIASLVKFGIRKASESAAEVQQLSGIFNNVVGDVVKAVAQGYSRDKEKEADLMAVDILHAAGYSASALSDVLSGMDSHSCHHGDPKIRSKNVQGKVKEKGYAKEALAVRTKRFKKAVH